jgi:FkbM family methyltransferase
LLSARSLIRAAKPEYLLRPHQIARRLWIEALPKTSAPTSVQLPWGYPIVVNPREIIGWAIYSRAIYELPLTEALFRLASPGDTVVDGGANIGYTTSILASRVGSTGRVHSFEPNPRAFAELRENVAVWQARGQRDAFVLHQEALGPRVGVATLHIPASSDWNGGRARIESSHIDEPGTRLDVAVVALDDLFSNGESISVVKLDLEGFELGALHGMENLLRERRVGAIVFEEHDPYPAPTHDFLKRAGYSIFGLDSRFLGIECCPERRPRFDPVLGPPSNYVATYDPEKTVRRLESGLWHSFGPGSYVST